TTRWRACSSSTSSRWRTSSPATAGPRSSTSHEPWSSRRLSPARGLSFSLSFHSSKNQDATVKPRSFITSLSSLLVVLALSVGCDIGTPGDPVGGDGDGDGDTGGDDDPGDDDGGDDLPPPDLLAIWSG